MNTAVKQETSHSIQEDFEKNGFTILKNVFSEKDLAPIRQFVERIVDYADQNLEDPFYRYYLPHRSDQGVLYDLFQRHPEFRSFATNPQILDAVETNLGKDIYLYENSLVYKPKSKKNEVPWHQDFISRPNEAPKYVAWIALDKVTKENGAMRVIPGSHKLGYLPWVRVRGETHHDRIPPHLIKEEQAVFVELNPGDVLIFQQLLLHSSLRIESDKPRRAYRVSYQGLKNSAYSPRTVPIVLRGGSPESLAKLYPRSSAETKLNRFVVILKKIAKRIMDL